MHKGKGSLFIDEVKTPPPKWLQAGEMARWFMSLAALSEDPGLTHKALCSLTAPVTPVLLTYTCVVHIIHTGRQIKTPTQIKLIGLSFYF